ncbi:MAG: TIM barrel protein [Gemmataceae bacterium]
MLRELPSRRTALGASLGMAALLAGAEAERPRGRIKQSICRWCYGKIPLEQLCQIARKIGYQSIELLGPEEYPTVKAAGLTCAVVRCASIGDGLNRKEFHDRIVKELEANIDFAATEKLPNVICMSGNRRGLDDEEGLKTCLVGLKRVIGYAEKKKVTIIMEGLNSRVDHKDYMYDRTSWGVDLCKRLGSDRFKLLYDIYHMQIMEGDIIRTVRTQKDYIGHYHTGGCPGRNEIDQTQELNYPAIVRAIIETGYTGYLGQEFLPRRDPVASMTEAFRLCDL